MDIWGARMALLATAGGGAELDSFADAIALGVALALALMVYFFWLHSPGNPS